MSKDNNLWEHFLLGDRNALKSIYLEHVDALIQYGRKYTVKHEIIEDSVQEVFLTLLRSHKNLSVPENLRSYLLSAFRHCLIREINRSRKKMQFANSDQRMDDDISFNIELDFSKDQIITKQKQLLNNLLISLSPRQREAIYLRYTNELSHGEIALVMNISEQVSRNLISQSIKRMKGQLDLLNVEIESFFLLFISPLNFSQKN